MLLFAALVCRSCLPLLFAASGVGVPEPAGVRLCPSVGCRARPRAGGEWSLMWCGSSPRGLAPRTGLVDDAQGEAAGVAGHRFPIDGFAEGGRAIGHERLQLIHVGRRFIAHRSDIVLIGL